MLNLVLESFRDGTSGRGRWVERAGWKEGFTEDLGQQVVTQTLMLASGSGWWINRNMQFREAAVCTGLSRTV